MSKGEKAQLEIEPEWAYGKKGQPDAKYPSMTSASLGTLAVLGARGHFMGRATGGVHLLQQAQDIPSRGIQGTSWGCSCPFLLEKNSCRGNLLLFSTCTCIPAAYD